MSEADASTQRSRFRITVHGIVQGVGFRPFVHRLASSLSLSGTVNNFTGGVHIEIEGPRCALTEFLRRLQAERPPISVIDDIRWQEIPPTGQRDFVIVPSQHSSGPIFVSPDVAICDDCRRELADPADRRFMHPFINCTNCGPRFTIIRRLPYDRPQTSMARFEMCPMCRAEYEDITNRRYHAQPVCCPNCGPTVWLASTAGHRVASGQAAIDRARRLLADGAIVAVKGLGGFHLVCDATNEDAVAELRRRKRRWQKPFAVMAPSVEAVAEFAVVDDTTRAVMTGPQAPIVLLAKRLPERLARAVAPDSADYGVMLPYTPLHILLFGPPGVASPFLALVMTSGNISDEPLCIDNDEAIERLGGIADAFLLHDRDILIGCDDSVVRATSRGPIMIRRSRGYAPLPVRLPLPVPATLGAGGHLKNTFCLASDTLAYPSQHIGDLDNAETLEYFRRSLARLAELCRIQPEAVACDLHPDYLSTKFAEQFAAERGVPLTRVQHHHAHLAACLADNGLTGPVVGLICDGTGYGPDGTVWGCEVLVGDLVSYQRVGHLRYCALPGGEQAIKQPWRMAISWLADTFGFDPAEWPEAAQDLADTLGTERVEAILHLVRRGVNSPYASSAGRLFDAVAALAGLKLDDAYEAQAAMMLEQAAASLIGPDAGSWNAPYPFATDEEPCAGSDAGAQACMVLDPRPMFEAIVHDLSVGRGAAHIAARFHATFIQMLADAAEWAAQLTGLSDVVLSGGTFQNRILLCGLTETLARRGLNAICHRGLSPNDSSICVGQVAVAGAQAAHSAAAGRARAKGKE